MIPGVEIIGRLDSGELLFTFGIPIFDNRAFELFGNFIKAFPLQFNMRHLIHRKLILLRAHDPRI